MECPPWRLGNVPNKSVERLDPICLKPFGSLTVIVLEQSNTFGQQHLIALIDEVYQGTKRIRSRRFIIVVKIMRIGKQIVRFSLQILQR